ncbi:MATE family efflux transporter [Abyssibius alkaniclasticus]|uniref:MATE family efflux transporter n=1 Tax=Abyssibius alkaniclasticus TaxID=2881234 RepID=UPI002363B217|nr:MATE family efflux transporter [Abyssibius alkaniclasticus]UPH71844.1 MATE family efflux transporter [Abyssibius alkaniclasticus]
MSSPTQIGESSFAPEQNNSWPAHIRATLALGLPLIGAQLAQMLMGVTDTLMLGWLGTEALAATVLGTNILFVLMITGFGFGTAVGALAAGAQGAGDVRAVRRMVRMGMWVSLAYAALVMPIMFFTEEILIAIGQDPDLSAVADSYLTIARWSLVPNLLILVLRSFLSVLSRAGVVLIFTLGAAALNAMLNYALIFGNWGAPALGVEGAAWATLGSSTLSLLLLVVYVIRHKAVRKYEVMVRFWRADWPAFMEVLVVGWPIGLTLLAEVGLFSFSAVMMGWFGKIPLAAHGIALQLASVSFMIPLGLSQAATVRIGIARGRKDRLGVQRAGQVILLMGGGISLLAAALFVIIPETLIGLFQDAANPETAAVLAYGVPLMAVAGAFQLVDSIQVMAAGLLRGLKDTRVPMYFAMISYWIIGVPCAYLLSQYTALEGVGIWLGLATGLTVASVLGLWRYGMRERLGLV